MSKEDQTVWVQPPLSGLHSGHGLNLYITICISKSAAWRRMCNEWAKLNAFNIYSHAFHAGMFQLHWCNELLLVFLFLFFKVIKRLTEYMTVMSFRLFPWRFPKFEFFFNG